MGQRSQIYIVVNNPLKNCENSGDIYSEERNKEAKLYFGTGKKSVIPFHHQWLYGATFAAVLSKILKEAKTAKGTCHPFSPDFKHFSDRNNFRKDAGYGFIEIIQNIISLPDAEVSEIAGRWKSENFVYIGDEHYDYDTKKKSAFNHQKRCDVGDNNDGILIVDIPSKKYCFMNIYDQDNEYGNVFFLPKLTPVSVAEYVRAYYPTVENSHTRSNSKSAKDMRETIKENKEIVAGITEILKEFEVLSLEEVQQLFPKTFGIKKGKVKTA